MKIHQKSILINETELSYTHIENNSPTICFMFSGAGYTYDKPLLYYSTMAMLERNYNVVHIHYSYENDLWKRSLTEITEIILTDVNPVITEVLNQRQYNQILFLGKSLGTIPIIDGFMKENLYPDSKMIVLTPLLKFKSIFQQLMKTSQKTLLIIGEVDPHYVPERVDALTTNSNIKIKKVPDANHSLEIEPINTSSSLNVLNKFVKTLEKFLN